MKKRVLSIILALCMIFTLLPVSALAAEPAVSGSCGKNATWSYADGTLTLSGTGAIKQYDGDNPAPWAVYKSEIKSIVVEDGITTLTDSCFGDSPMVETVSLGSTVKISGRNPFVYLDELKNVTVSEKNTGYCAVGGVLYNKGKTTLVAYPASKNGSSFTIPSTVKTVGDCAFSSCNKLTSVTVPAGVTKLDNYAFYSCENLKSISMPKKLSSIGDHAFAYCSSLTEMTVPEGVTVIENGTFYGCSSMKKLTLPVSLAEIKGYSIVRCEKLTDIYYNGTKNQWKLVKVDESNDCLRKAKMHYGTLKVSTPTISIATSAGKPKISWTKILGAEKYLIYRSTDGKSFKQYATTTKTSYTNSSAKIGTTYYYKIKAVVVSNGKNVTSGYSNTKSIKCRPAAPVVSVSRSGGKAKLTWKAVDGASKYWIYRSTDGYTFKQYATTAKTSYTNTGASSGTRYFYKVKSVAVVNKKNVASAYSSSKSFFTTLAAPTVKITTSAGCPKLSWASVKGAEKYSIYRSTDGKNYKQYTTTTKTSYTNTSTTIGTTYYYKVKAICGVTSNANSALSAAKSIKRVPAAPKVNISLGANDKPVLTWNSVSGASKYMIYRSTDGKNYKQYTTTTKTSYTNTKTTAGTTYYYKVKAVAVVNGSNVASAFSKAVSLTAAVQSGKCGDNVSWKLSGSTLYISGTGKMYDYDNRSNKSPWKKSISSVVISEGVESIGSYAFYGCESLSNVSIPGSVKVIGERAFLFCSIDRITLPEGVESLGDSAFGDNEYLKSIKLPSTLKSIGDSCFSSCLSLESITLPEGLESIGDKAFARNPIIKTLDIPASVKDLGETPCLDCESFTGYTVSADSPYYCLVDDVLYSKDMTRLIYCNGGETQVTAYTVPEGVKIIEDYAFHQANLYYGISLPASLEEIGDDAFYGTWLCSVTLPDGLKNVGESAFANCKYLTTVVFSGEVEEIGTQAFMGCEKLTDIVLPEGIEVIGDRTFYGCYMLANVTIPSSVKSIGNSVFIHGGSNAITIYYRGTETQWNQISIGNDNPRLDNAKMVFNYK